MKEDVAEIIKFFYNLDGFSGETCKLCRNPMTWKNTKINVLVIEGQETWQCPNCKAYGSLSNTYHVGNKKHLEVFREFSIHSLHEFPDYGFTKADIEEGIKLAMSKRFELAEI